LDYLKDYEKIIDSILVDDRIRNLWFKYTRKNKYAQNIEIDEILNLLKECIEEIGIVLV